MPDRPHSSGFTLVEVLVVVAIIAILAGILIPAIGSVREKSRRITCANAHRQCGLALIAFAGDHNDRLPNPRPNGVQNADTYFVQGSGLPSLVDLLDGYLDDLSVWRCPSTRAAPINDERNTRGVLRGNLIYWPWLSHGAFHSPGIMAQHTASTILLQDQLYIWGGGWRANHCRSGARRMPYADNPSLDCVFEGKPTGFNALFGDGHVAWSDLGPDVVVVYAPGPSDHYSLAPSY